jgi:urease beta subunit
VLIGEIIPKNRDIILNAGRKTAKLTVSNKGARPVQVGSHFHFFEVNRLLSFDRRAAFGMRLDIPSGTAVRFEPGETKTVNLVAMGGRKKMFGCSGLAAGAGLNDAMERLEKWLTK